MLVQSIIKVDPDTGEYILTTMDTKFAVTLSGKDLDQLKSDFENACRVGYGVHLLLKTEKEGKVPEISELIFNYQMID